MELDKVIAELVYKGYEVRFENGYPHGDSIQIRLIYSDRMMTALVHGEDVKSAIISVMTMQLKRMEKEWSKTT